MDVKEINSQIEQNQEQVRVLRQELENMVPAIIEAVAQSTITWSKAKARAIAEEVLTHQPLRQEELGEKMLGLKADVDKLAERIPVETEELVSSDQFWVHRGQNLESGLDGRGTDWSEPAWEDAKAVLYGFVGELLLRHKFISEYGHDWRVARGNESKH